MYLLFDGPHLSTSLFCACLIWKAAVCVFEWGCFQACISVSISSDYQSFHFNFDLFVYVTIKIPKYRMDDVIESPGSSAIKHNLQLS